MTDQFVSFLYRPASIADGVLPTGGSPHLDKRISSVGSRTKFSSWVKLIEWSYAGACRQSHWQRARMEPCVANVEGYLVRRRRSRC